MRLTTNMRFGIVQVFSEASNAASHFPRRELAEISFQPRYTSDVVFMIEKPFKWGARTYIKPNHVNDKRRYYREEYLKSEHWKNLKSSKLSANPFCQSCGGNSCLDVHHIRYRDLFNVELSDLLTLCRNCHETLHKWMREYTLLHHT